MSSTDTSIKVPRRVRDRLQKRARRDHTTLAAALDEAEELEFWNQVREHHASLSEAERDSYVHDRTLGDHLSGTDDTGVAEEDW
ncbi:hypothetical protein [Nocardiopsis salina]|uniref:hypothetical protein n=1 Tax=Nocardiopsis salina TaxID=245836 RepID=UPI00036909A3|nr:hypothetical protein [Nocardiopsis salina]